MMLFFFVCSFVLPPLPHAYSTRANTADLICTYFPALFVCGGDSLRIRYRAISSVRDCSSYAVLYAVLVFSVFPPGCTTTGIFVAVKRKNITINT